MRSNKDLIKLTRRNWSNETMWQVNLYYWLV